MHSIHNQKLKEGTPVIFGGDVTQDGNIDSSDMNWVLNKNEAFAKYYCPEDVTGDGNVDSSDMNIVLNNNESFIKVKIPPLP